MAMIKKLNLRTCHSLLIVSLMVCNGCATKLDTTTLPDNMEFGPANEQGYKRIEKITYSQPLPQMAESEYLDRLIECVDHSVFYESAWASRARVVVRKDPETGYAGEKQDLVESSNVIIGVYPEGNRVRAAGITTYPAALDTVILRFSLTAALTEPKAYQLQFDSIEIAMNAFLDTKGFIRATNNAYQQPEKIYEKTRLMAEAFDRCINTPGEGVPADVQINLIPMYGYPDIQKTERQKHLDAEFIRMVSRSQGSRENAGREFAARGWHYLQQGDADTAMRRFNQSWLLNPDDFMPYWGFGVLLKRRGDAAGAVSHFDRALSLIDDEDGDRPRLLADAAMAYTDLGHDLATTDEAKSKESFTKANSLAREVLKVDARFGSEALRLEWQFREAYSYGAYVYHDQGNYLAAWGVVKKSRESGGYVYRPGFIEELSMKMSEPR